MREVVAGHSGFDSLRGRVSHQEPYGGSYAYTVRRTAGDFVLAFRFGVGGLWRVWFGLCGWACVVGHLWLGICGRGTLRGTQVARVGQSKL